MPGNREIEGFRVLRVTFSLASTSPHELFIKEHSVRAFDEMKPPGRTLFVVNIPPYAHEGSLKRAFAKCGKVKSVTLQKNSSENSEENTKFGFRIGYVVFQTRESLLNALKLESLGPLSTEQVPVLTGLHKWIHQYNSSVWNHDKLRERVDSFMKKYDRKEEEKKDEKEQEVDDEGWTVVTKKGRNPGISRKESVENKLIQKNKQKSKKRELKNFYTFQIKEQKMKNLIALRKSFQESKEKVEAMKKLRHFKPY